MSVIVIQTFELKQDKFPEGIKNLRLIQNFRNEQYDHRVELLSPISGEDHTYVLVSTYEGLAEMELQNKKMFEDEEYKELVGEFFLENIVQGSMYTQLYRTMTGLSKDSENDKSKN
ncbi:hypothetical protein J7E38_18470 [Bacillus sp. ISL-35]|uniref:hypothetical protein n=1 Tax=Bacillus sp. ISL-35 TaxID=2819122 RepID=UPI001BE64135|nr:hypothetical protein [Bacillus sp. ISL-35]MBT2680978.1 hypothetical protein [Bacillus sp. ISL-35]MBT2705297.1 hypothetical protein [Chryseobacterium sp. ISL-80]